MEDIVGDPWGGAGSIDQCWSPLGSPIRDGGLGGVSRRLREGTRIWALKEIAGVTCCPRRRSGGTVEERERDGSRYPLFFRRRWSETDIDHLEMVVRSSTLAVWLGRLIKWRRWRQIVKVEPSTGTRKGGLRSTLIDSTEKISSSTLVGSSTDGYQWFSRWWSARPMMSTTVIGCVWNDSGRWNWRWSHRGRRRSILQLHCKKDKVWILIPLPTVVDLSAVAAVEENLGFF